MQRQNKVSSTIWYQFQGLNCFQKALLKQNGHLNIGRFFAMQINCKQNFLLLKFRLSDANFEKLFPYPENEQISREKYLNSLKNQPFQFGGIDAALREVLLFKLFLNDVQQLPFKFKDKCFRFLACYQICGRHFFNVYVLAPAEASVGPLKYSL